jgi:hypothetical protein
MRTLSRFGMALGLVGTSLVVSLATAAPASACTGDGCDGFCAVYAQLPPAVQQKVFRSTGCPIE